MPPIAAAGQKEVGVRGYIASRLLQSILVVFGVSLVVFVMMRMSGDPSYLMLPMEATEADRQQFRHELGLDQPIYVQYARFVSRAVQGDFGESLYYKEPALGIVLERLPATITLAVAAMLIAVVIAVPGGIVSAVKRGTVLDNLAMIGIFIGQSMPLFWLGIMLILTLSVSLKLFPSSGIGSGLADIKFLVLPALTLGLYSTAKIARLVRAGMLDVLGHDYVRTARGKGIPERAVIIRHALKNALLPVITLLGLQVGDLLGGAVITETVFAWPGVGRLAVSAIFQRDYPIVQTAVMVTAVMFVFVNLAVDIAYTFVDPRIRYQ